MRGCRRCRRCCRTCCQCSSGETFPSKYPVSWTTWSSWKMFPLGSTSIVKTKPNRSRGQRKKTNEILETIITQNSSDLSESESLSTSNVNSREMSSSLLTSLSKRTCLEKTKNFGLFFLAQSPDRCKSRKKHSPSFQIFVTLSPKTTFRTPTSTSKMPVFCGDCRPQRRSFFG